MKHRFAKWLATLLACASVFAFATACGNKDDGINLAGKQIVADVNNAHVNWEYLAYTNSYYDIENEKLYAIDMTLEAFIEEYVQEGIFSQILNTPNLDTVEKVKAALIEYALPEILVQYPGYSFSADASTVTKYAATDINFTTPLTTYNVQLEQQHTRRIYSLYDNHTQVATIDCTNTITCSTGGLCPIELDLSAFTDIMVTLTAEDGSTCQVPMCRYENELDEFFGKILSVSIFMQYKIV